ncbi:hypothetical protein FQN55_001890 [Onygenales sp. PD_40]|nr:hypothetical protein FQN55_001890 [Onygenales sp. PD_40]KAK2786005.1 hypothetical protein FQN52_008001 [Onygenales sp. PD_12]KAK2792813.1 hypothetical protein FQN51_001573 [Onygenales sp. PD_10]
MGSPRYSELGLSLGMLEEDLHWYWKLFASLSSWLLLAGFVVFPLAIDRNADNLRGGTFAITAAAIALTAMGYIVCIGFALRWRKRHYLVDFIYIPCFGSSLIGVFNVALNIIVRRLQPLDALAIAVITIASVSTAVFGAAAVYNSHNVLFVPRRSNFRRRNEDPSLNDAELQRRQLLRLYLQNDADRAPSPEVTQSTFRIDLPDPGVDADEELTVKPPRQTYERGIPPPSPPPGYDPSRRYDRSSSAGSISKGPGRIRGHPPRETRRSIVELGDL